MLVAAFSAVVAFGALSGLSGAKSDAHETGGVQSAVVAGDDDVVMVPADSKWD
ncbi:hypothetical protein ABZT06_33200 [Streptomyces sp. NPDC005483]|uniref:hypothetical protein n=1 Tax=Streptomyces sp. NPDC005483 TaxID=3154882 RepID=UPI0033B69BAA